MIHSSSNPRLSSCLVVEVAGSFGGFSWQAAGLSQGKRPHSYQGMIAAAGKPSQGSRTRPQTA